MTKIPLFCVTKGVIMAESAIFVLFVSVIGADWLFSLNVMCASPVIGCGAVVLFFSGSVRFLLNLCCKNSVGARLFCFVDGFLMIFVVDDGLKMQFCVIFKAIKHRYIMI